MRPRHVLGFLWFVAASAVMLTCRPVFAQADVVPPTPPDAGLWVAFWLWVAANPGEFVAAVAAVAAGMLTIFNLAIARIRKRWPNVGDALASGVAYVPWIVNSIGKALANRQLKKRGLPMIPYEEARPSERPPAIHEEPPGDDPPRPLTPPGSGPMPPLPPPLRGPTSGPGGVPLGRLLLACLMALLLVGCTLKDLVRSADAASVAGEAARPVLKEHCADPMIAQAKAYAEAKSAGDKPAQDAAQAAARDIDKPCLPAIKAQKLLLRLHAALRAAIVAIESGQSPPGVEGLVLDVARAGVQLGKALLALKEAS